MLFTESQIRGHAVDKINKNYMRCFKEGFLKLVSEEKVLDKIEEESLYKEFLSLSFPVNKVSQVIEKEFGETIDNNIFAETTRKNI